MSRASETHHHGDEFVAPATQAPPAAGLQSWGRRLDALIDAHARRVTPTARRGGCRQDARLIDFVLGSPRCGRRSGPPSRRRGRGAFSAQGHCSAVRRGGRVLR
ncbi:MAG: hypothetical protein IPN17_06605 [Deltaproteobacteria bacterium]|nr:hypothetical protein [Deltaproteobacteria bacterium]